MTPRRSRARLGVAMVGLLFVLLNLVVLAVFTWPRLTRVRRAEARAAEVSARRGDLERLWAQVEARKELVARNRADIESLTRDHLKARTEDLFAAQREIEKLAREAGLHPKMSTYVLVDVKGTNLVRCDVTLPLDGSYANLTGFLSLIASARRFIVVDQMALAQDDQAARMNLRLSVIFRDGVTHASP